MSLQRSASRLLHLRLRHVRNRQRVGRIKESNDQIAKPKPFLSRVTLSFVSWSTSFVVVLLILIIGINLWKNPILIEPISVTKEMNENGFGPEIAAIQLRDAINILTMGAQTTIRRRDIMGHASSPDIIIPSVGISIQAFAAQLLDLAGFKRQNISGNFIVSGDFLYLNIRMGAELNWVGKEKHNAEAVNVLMKQASKQIIRVTQPYVFASIEYNINKNESLKIVERIINSNNVKREDLKFAHLLKGLILNDFGRRQDAMKEYQSAVEIDKHFAPAFNNMGIILDAEGKSDLAIEKYNIAKKVDKNFYVAYNNLAIDLESAGKLVESLREYQSSLNINPEFVAAHYNLAGVLSKLNRKEESIKEYQAAIELDPKDASLHNGLGVEYEEWKMPKEAVREYVSAIELRPDYAVAYFNLGITLEGEGKTDQANESYRKAAEIDPSIAQQVTLDCPDILERLKRCSLDGQRVHPKAIRPINHKSGVR